MTQIKKAASEHKYIILISILLFFGIYGLNHYFPITLDDWTYSMMADGSRVDSLWDILQYQYVHYFNWGGRSVVHTIAQVMLAAGVFWGDVINSAGYVALVLTIYYITNKGNKSNLSLFIGVNLLIWFLVPALIENIFWITGSANYLWGTLLILLFISFYCSAFLTNQSHDSGLKRIALFLFGVIAGWTNENMAVAMIFFVFCLIILMRKEHQALPKWMIWGLAGAIIGCAFMLLAPGNYIRNAGEIESLNPGAAEPFYVFYFYRFTSILKVSSWYALIPTIIYVLFLLLYPKYKKKETDRRVLLLSLLFAVTAGVATLAMIAAPIFPERVWFAILVFLFLGTGLLYANLNFSLSYIKRSLYSIIGVAALVFFYSYWVSLNDFIRIHDIWAERDSIVLAEKQRGVKDVVIYGRFRASDSWFVRPKTGDIPLDSISWMQNAYGLYMGVNSVKVLDSDK
ncbi:MAG: DUF6056 family protein [Prevotella sp.]|jgi:hypothetical protein|nr:DUF6056 family protein [Prevotella sp.]